LHLPMEAMELLKEIRIGEIQGQIGREVARSHPELWRRWLSSDPDFAFPGGETRRHLAERGVRAFRTIAEHPYRAVVVASHGAILTATFKWFMGIPSDHPPFALQNGSITTCELTRDGRFVMHDRDNVSHLSSGARSGPGDLPI
ncbi:MAG: histidine phosphatase family protein, partial [Planctomycetia bacterium]|nr:histidine phosphatase family protein [Planctomycetia bacterium]